MKNILIITLLILGVNHFFINDPLKSNFYFNGKKFDHVDKISGGEITNHFYTPNGNELNESYSFIQIIEFKKETEKSNWPLLLNPLFQRYKLTPLTQDELSLIGNTEKSGLFFNSYGTPISINNKDHMAFYLLASENKLTTETKSEKHAVIENLRNIVFN